MTMSCKVQRIQPGDEREIVELLDLVFEGWPKFDLNHTSLEHWEWKFLDNPRVLNIDIKAVSDGKIVGCYHGVDMRVKIGEDLVHVNNGVDVAVHPDYRKLGIYRKMNKRRIKLRVENGAQIGVWSSGNPIIIKSPTNPDRFVFPKPLPILVRIRNPGLHYRVNPSGKSFIIKLGFRILRFINEINNVFKPKSQENPDICVSEIHSFDDRIAKFWDEVSVSYSFIVERSREYLNWRYCDTRGGDYTVFLAEEDARIVGYCVCRINRIKTEYPEGFFVDLLTLPDRIDVVEKLVKRTMDCLDNEGVNIIRGLTVRNSQFERILKKYGFVDSRMEQYVAVSPRGMNVDEIKLVSREILMKDLHFVYGDFDWI
jgi:GNAT superfamily N-acetyltransferase